MMITIAMLSMTLGFFLGYKVGFNRCVCKFTTILEILRKEVAVYNEQLKNLTRK